MQGGEPVCDEVKVLTAAVDGRELLCRCRLDQGDNSERADPKSHQVVAWFLQVI